MNQQVKIEASENGTKMCSVVQPSILKAARGIYVPGQESLNQFSQSVSAEPAEPATYHGMMARARRQASLDAE